MNKRLLNTITRAVLIAVTPICMAMPPAYPQVLSSPEYEQLKKDYEKAVSERNNILLQLKSLLEYKTRAIDLEKKVKYLEEEREKAVRGVQTEKENAVKTLQEEKKQLASELKRLKDKIAQLTSKFQEDSDAFQLKVQDIEKTNAQLSKDREALTDTLEKLKIEYKILPETKKKLIRLENEKSQFLKDSKKMEQKFKAMEEERINKDAQLEIYRMQINDLKKRHTEALAKNREFEKRLEKMPERIAELSRENKVLIKETAFTHYNLGVFYAKNKEYTRALAEFEKAAELNPDDPYVYYNLGYIYAEYMPDRPKAIEYFRKFLRLCKTDDADVDWVKKYILTWQTWEGKQTLK